jgi:hypothetical protein
LFSRVIDIEEIESTEIFDVLYKYFDDDFISNKTYLNSSIYIDPQSHKKDEDKELSFWHLTSRDTKIHKKKGKRWFTEIHRVLDYRRAERLSWIKKIIENYTITDIKVFYHQESNEKRDIRLYLWLEKFDFVVILQKLGNSSSFLVTSFYVDRDGKRKEYTKRYNKYISKTDIKLKNCEWF